jgi:hypothetical protein
MKSWEFLIQKDGDIKWYPASSRNLQLEPGKYRILGKSNRFNTVVEVRISSQDQETQYHQRRLNSQGLVMLLPFTELSSGTSFNIRCHGDVLSEFLGESWQETITLNIPEVATPQTVDNLPSKESNDQTESQDKSQYYLEKLQKLIQEKVEPKLTHNKQPIEESKVVSQPRRNPKIDISLDENDLVINGDERLSLSGKIKAVDIEGDIALTAKLRYQLIHPETDVIILTVDYPLSDEKLPSHFAHTLVIPDSINHHFLRGELFLETMKGYPLAHCSFKITINQYYPINCTIELVDIETDDCYKFNLELAERISKKHHQIELPNTDNYSKLFPSHFFKQRQVLPPKLGQNIVRKKGKSLKLPQVNHCS